MDDKVSKRPRYGQHTSDVQVQALRPRHSRLRSLIVLALGIAFTLFSLSHYHIGDIFPTFRTQTSKHRNAPVAYCSPQAVDTTGQPLKSIYTVDANNTEVECIVVRGGVIVQTGSYDNVVSRWYNGLERSGERKEISKEARGRKLKVVRIPEGSVIVPGLTDSHCHILQYGYSQAIQIEDAKSPQEVAERVAEYIKSHPDVLDDPTHVIEGWGWNHEAFEGTKFPTADDLSSHPLLADRQIILLSKDGHASWVSRKTLDLNKPYPPEIFGGVIARDSQTGEPTGVFIDAAQDLITPPVITDKTRLKRFTTTVQHALAVGLTSLHDAGQKPDELAFFSKQARKKGGLPIRVYAMKAFNASTDSYWGGSARRVDDMGGNSRLSVRSVKMFADGALRTAGAALYEPYSDNPSTSGLMQLTKETLNTVIPRFIQDGWQVNVHAIGDRANGLILNAYQLALEAMNLTTFEGSAVRPRIEHAQVLAPRDAARLTKMGVIASVQPTHVTSDMWYGEERLGPKRITELYPFRDLLSSGGRLTLGSDFPVEGVNPLNGFYAAVTRLSPDGTSPHGPGGWFPNQRLTRTEALRGMTIEPAYASFTEQTLGSLEVGKKADFVVLDRDVMQVPFEEILGTKVLGTWIDGVKVYSPVQGGHERE